MLTLIVNETEPLVLMCPTGQVMVVVPEQVLPSVSETQAAPAGTVKVKTTPSAASEVAPSFTVTLYTTLAVESTGVGAESALTEMSDWRWTSGFTVVESLALLPSNTAPELMAMVVEAVWNDSVASTKLVPDGGVTLTL